MKLSELEIGSTKTISEIKIGEKKIRRRLLDMGLTPGAVVYLRKKAPLGDPIEINLRGYELTLRKKEAELVILKESFN